MSRELFQPGDYVYVKTWGELMATEGVRGLSTNSIVVGGVGFVQEMKVFCGKEFIISKYAQTGRLIGYNLKYPDGYPAGGFLFNDEMLKPVTPIEFDESEFMKLLEGI